MEPEELKEVINKSSSVNRTLGITFALFIFYVLVNVASTTDLMIFLPKSKILLPMLNIELPLKAFYIAVPFLVILLHYNLLTNLQQHSKKLNDWVRLRSKNIDILDPFLLNYVTTKLSKLHRIILILVIRITTFILPLVVLIYIQLRFSDYQSWTITSWHFSIVLLDFLMIVTHSDQILVLIQKEKAKSKGLKGIIKCFKYEAFLLPVSIIYFLLFVFLMTVNIRTTGFAGVTEWFPKISLADQKLVIKEPDQQIMQLYVNGEIEKIYETKLKFTKGYNLEERSFRLAEFDGAILTNANFKYADLQGAAFFDAYLEGVNFYGANLENTYLNGANMQGADFTYTKMGNSSLHRGNLQDAILFSAIFSPGSDFHYVNFQGAEISNVDLTASMFKGVNMRGMNVRNTILEGALIENSILQGINFDDVHFWSAVISNSDLTGSYFYNCQLQAGYFNKVNLNGCVFDSTKTKGMSVSDIFENDTIIVRRSDNLSDDFSFYTKGLLIELLETTNDLEVLYYVNNCVQRMDSASTRYYKDSSFTIQNLNCNLMNKIDDNFLLLRRKIASSNIYTAQGMLVRNHIDTGDTLYNDLMSYIKEIVDLKTFQSMEKRIERQQPWREGKKILE